MASYSSDPGSFRALSQHEVYFLNGGDLYFLVEHVHFRVHRYFFERESPFFQRRLTISASPGATRPGSTESNAIILEEPSEDFAKFLWVFYNPRYSLYHATINDWKVILRLAYTWQFAEVKKLVVRELEKLEMNDVDRIATYHRYEIDRNLLMPRYAALCAREEPLTLQEGRDLGLETTLMIARAREYARANPSSGGIRSPIAAGIHQDEMFLLIRQLFEIPTPSGESEGMVNGAMTPPGGLLSAPLQHQTSLSSTSPPPPPPLPPVKQTVKQTAKPAEVQAQAPVPNEPALATPPPPPSLPPKPQAPAVETPANKATNKQTGKQKGNKKNKQQTGPQTPTAPPTEATPISLSVPSLAEEKTTNAANETPFLDIGSSWNTSSGQVDDLLKNSFGDSGFGADFLDVKTTGVNGAEASDVFLGSHGVGETDLAKPIDDLAKIGDLDALDDQGKIGGLEQIHTTLNNGTDELEAAKAAVGNEL